MPIPQARDVDVTRTQLTAWLRAEAAACDRRRRRRDHAAERQRLLERDVADRRVVARRRRARRGAARGARPADRLRDLPRVRSPSAVPHDGAPRRRPASRCRAMRWYEDDASVLGQPFYVMDRVDGVIPADHPPFAHGGWLFDATPAQQSELARSALDRARRAAPARLARARLRVPGAAGVRRDAVRAAARLLHDDAALGRGRSRHAGRRRGARLARGERPAHEPAAEPHLGRRSHRQHDLPRLPAGRGPRLGDGDARPGRGRSRLVARARPLPHRRRRRGAAPRLSDPRADRRAIRGASSAAGCRISSTTRCGARFASRSC